MLDAHPHPVSPSPGAVIDVSPSPGYDLVPFCRLDCIEGFQSVQLLLDTSSLSLFISNYPTLNDIEKYGVGQLTNPR